ncbi:MAG: hypothetical protein EOP21_10560, partial [Hyphomicrobiales bacterium]
MTTVLRTDVPPSPQVAGEEIADEACHLVGALKRWQVRDASYLVPRTARHCRGDVARACLDMWEVKVALDNKGWHRNHVEPPISRRPVEIRPYRR